MTALVAQETRGESTLTPSRRWLLLPAVVVSVMTLSLGQTIVIPILGSMARTLHASAPSVAWAVTANLLGGAVSSPLLGRLADTHGKRPVLLGVLLATCVGSLVAATTSSLPLLITARALQGSSFSLFAVGVAVLRDELPATGMATGMSAISAALGLGGGLGLAMSGVLTSAGGDYQGAFWLAFGVGLLALCLAGYAVPHSTGVSSDPVDWTGAAALGSTLLLLLLPLSRGHDWGWTSAPTLACLAGAVLAGAGWLTRQGRASAPILNSELMRNRALLRTNLAGLLVGVALFVSFLSVSAFAQVPRDVAGYGFSATVFQTSMLYLLPGALIGVGTAPLAARLVRHSDARSALLRALVLGFLGFAFMAYLHQHPWQIMVGCAIVNVALSFAFTAMPSLIVSVVAADETSIATSMNSIARATGGSLASALVVTLLSSETIPQTGLPSQSAFVSAFLIGALGCGLAALALFVRFPCAPAPSES